MGNFHCKNGNFYMFHIIIILFWITSIAVRQKLSLEGGSQTSVMRLKFRNLVIKFPRSFPLTLTRLISPNCETDAGVIESNHTPAGRALMYLHTDELLKGIAAISI